MGGSEGGAEEESEKVAQLNNELKEYNGVIDLWTSRTERSLPRPSPISILYVRVCVVRLCSSSVTVKRSFHAGKDFVE